MYHKHHTKGIILESWGEGDKNLRVKVLTEHFGLLSVKVQGARLASSKLRSGCQQFSIGNFSFVKGKTGWKMVSSSPEKNCFETLKSFPEKLIVMGNVLNLSKRLLGEEENSAPIFSLVSTFLNLLQNAKTRELPMLECFVLMKLLFALGYMKEDPELLLPVSFPELELASLEMLLPKRAKMISLINESLKATQI